MSPKVGKRLAENHRISHRYTTALEYCGVPVGAGKPANKATRFQMETTKNDTIIANPANHTSERKAAQSAR